MGTARHPPPRKVQIETFLGCNARCTMCTIHEWTRPHGQMDAKVFETIVSQLGDFRNELEAVSLYMDGEPLMDRDLEDRIEHCKKAGLTNVGFATNGSLLTADRAARILDAGTDWIAISFESLSKERFERIRIRLKFETVMNNVLGLIAARNDRNSRLKISLRYIEQDINAGEFGEYKRFWSDRLDPELDEIRYFGTHNWAHGEALGTNPCGFVFDRAVVLRDGTVPLCCVDYNGEHRLGNVMESHILDIWNGAEWQRIRELHEARQRRSLKLCGQCNIPDAPTDAGQDQF